MFFIFLASFPAYNRPLPLKQKGAKEKFPKQEKIPMGLD